MKSLATTRLGTVTFPNPCESKLKPSKEQIAQQMKGPLYVVYACQSQFGTFDGWQSIHIRISNYGALERE